MYYLDERGFCCFECRKRNFYDDWCLYYNKDADLVYDCEYFQKKLEKEEKRRAENAIIYNEGE